MEDKTKTKTKDKTETNQETITVNLNIKGIEKEKESIEQKLKEDLIKRGVNKDWLDKHLIVIDDNKKK